MNTLIKNVDIITMDQQNSKYTKGCIAIEGQKIAWVGEEVGLPDSFHADEIIDGEGKLALPGFINTHTHVAMTLFRGYGNDLPLWEWLTEKIWPLEEKLEDMDAYWLSLLGIAEMLMGGVTTFSDMYMHMEYVARAVEEAGIRAVLSRGLQGWHETSHIGLKENRDLYEKWHGQADGRIRVMVGPHAVYTCEPDFLKECKKLADELGVGLHIHLSETRKEVEDCKKEYGKSPVEHLNDLGLLDGHVLAAHCVHLSPEDMDIMKQKDVKVAHCPISNLKLGSGIAPTDELLERGVCVSLGTDGVSSNNNLSMIKEMSFAALLRKGVKEDPTLIPAHTALKMATYFGAKALAWEDQIGSLEVGKQADIVLIDITKPNYQPKLDMESHLVYSAHTGDVDSVWVAGKQLVKDKRLLTIDLERVYNEVEKIQARIMY